MSAGKCQLPTRFPNFLPCLEPIRHFLARRAHHSTAIWNSKRMLKASIGRSPLSESSRTCATATKQTQHDCAARLGPTPPGPSPTILRSCPLLSHASYFFFFRSVTNPTRSILPNLRQNATQNLPGASNGPTRPRSRLQSGQRPPLTYIFPSQTM